MGAGRALSGADGAQGPQLQVQLGLRAGSETTLWADLAAGSGRAQMAKSAERSLFELLHSHNDLVLIIIGKAAPAGAREDHWASDHCWLCTHSHNRLPRSSAKKAAPSQAPRAFQRTTHSVEGGLLIGRANAGGKLLAFCARVPRC